MAVAPPKTLEGSPDNAARGFGLISWGNAVVFNAVPTPDEQSLAVPLSMERDDVLKRLADTRLAVATKGGSSLAGRRPQHLLDSNRLFHRHYLSAVDPENPAYANDLAIFEDWFWEIVAFMAKDAGIRMKVLQKTLLTLYRAANFSEDSDETGALDNLAAHLIKVVEAKSSVKRAKEAEERKKEQQEYEGAYPTRDRKRQSILAQEQTKKSQENLRTVRLEAIAAHPIFLFIEHELGSDVSRWQDLAEGLKTLPTYPRRTTIFTLVIKAVNFLKEGEERYSKLVERLLKVEEKNWGPLGELIDSVIVLLFPGDPKAYDDNYKLRLLAQDIKKKRIFRTPGQILGMGAVGLAIVTLFVASGGVFPAILAVAAEGVSLASVITLAKESEENKALNRASLVEETLRVAPTYGDSTIDLIIAVASVIFVMATVVRGLKLKPKSHSKQQAKKNVGEQNGLHIPHLEGGKPPNFLPDDSLSKRIFNQARQRRKAAKGPMKSTRALGGDVETYTPEDWQRFARKNPALAGTRYHKMVLDQARKDIGKVMGDGWELVKVESSVGGTRRVDSLWVNHRKQKVFVEDIFTGQHPDPKHLRKTWSYKIEKEIQELKYEFLAADAWRPLIDPWRALQ